MPPGEPGGTLTTVALGNVPHLDVQQEVQETLTSLGPGIVYSRLLRLSTGPDVLQPGLVLECELCESWKLSDLEPLTYTFKLKEGIAWHRIDPVSGRELTAEDVVYSYERLRSPGSQNARLLGNMDTVEADDPHTLRVSLKSGVPDADLLVSLADGHAKVVAREAVALKGDLRDGPVIGTGPWIWKSTTENIGSEFERNPDYFEEGLPFADRFVTRVIRAGQEVQLAAFLTGAVDVYRVSPESWGEFKQELEEFPSFTSKEGGVGLILTMNVSTPPFNDERVRKAVFKALDPWEYVRSIWGDQGFVSLGMPLRSADWLLNKAEMRSSYFADPSEASDMLSDLDIPKPIGFDLTVADYGDIFLRQGERIQQDLESVEFAPRAVVVNPTQYEEKVFRDKDYQLAVGLLPPFFPSTNGFLLGLLYSAIPAGNITRHSDEKLDADIIDQLRASHGLDARRELVREIQRYLLDRAYLFAPVTGSIGTGARWVLQPRVQGFYPNTAASEYFYWAKTWVE